MLYVQQCDRCSRYIILLFLSHFHISFLSFLFSFHRSFDIPSIFAFFICFFSSLFVFHLLILKHATIACLTFLQPKCIPLIISLSVLNIIFLSKFLKQGCICLLQEYFIFVTQLEHQFRSASIKKHLNDFS